MPGLEDQITGYVMTDGFGNKVQVPGMLDSNLGANEMIQQLTRRSLMSAQIGTGELWWDPKMKASREAWEARIREEIRALVVKHTGHLVGVEPLPYSSADAPTPATGVVSGADLSSQIDPARARQWGIQPGPDHNFTPLLERMFGPSVGDQIAAAEAAAKVQGAE